MKVMMTRELHEKLRSARLKKQQEKEKFTRFNITTVQYGTIRFALFSGNAL